MKHILVVIGVAAWACLCPPVYAQLSVPDVLGSQFSGGSRNIATRLTLLDPFRGVTPPTGFSLGYEDEKTVHTIRRGQGVLEDLHANSRFQDLRLTLGRSLAAPLFMFHDRQADNGGVLEEQGGSTGNRVSLHGHLENPEAGLRWSLFGGSLTLVQSRAAYAADGQSNVYQNLFQIFPSTPPFRFEKQTTLRSADLAVPVARGLSLEVVVGREEAPGFLALGDPRGAATEIRLPLADGGPLTMRALRWQPSPRLTLALFDSRSHDTGDGDVLREGGRVIGHGHTDRDDLRQGLGGQLRFGGSRTLGLYAEYDRSRLDTNGDVPSPSQLGLNVPFLSDGHYHARYALSSRTFGVNWDQQYRAGHALSLGYRRVFVDPQLEANYQARLLLVGVTGDTQFAPGSVHGHLLQARYRFPIAGLFQEVQVSQVIPDATHGGSSTSGGNGGGAGAKSSPRETSGGWSLSWTIEKPF